MWLRLGALKLQQIIDRDGVLQRDLVERTRLDKSLILKYVRGVLVPGAKHRKLIKATTSEGGAAPAIFRSQAASA